jgi:hypothetical protein
MSFDEGLANTLINDGTEVIYGEKKFLKLLDFVDQTLIVASDIGKLEDKTAGKFLGVDFPTSGLVIELCAISLSSILVAYHYLIPFYRYVKPSPPVLKKINEIFDFSGDIMEFEIEPIDELEELSSKEFIQHINKLLSLSKVLLSHFTVEGHLQHFANIRRVQFNIICSSIQMEELSTLNPLIESLSPILNDFSYLGIVSNLSIANSFIESREIAFHYLISAANISWEKEFGDQIRNELTLIALYYNSGGTKHDDFIKKLLHTKIENLNYFSYVLKKSKEEDLCPLFLETVNIYSDITDKNLKSGFREIVQAFMDEKKKHDITSELRSMMDLFELEEKIENKEHIDAEQVFLYWKGREKLWTYAGALRRLVEMGYSDDKILKAAVQILKDRIPYEDDYNVYFLLANSIGYRYLKKKVIQDHKDILVHYLENSVGKWDSISTPQGNVDFYELLLRLKPGSEPMYMNEVAKWRIIKLRADHLKKIPQLINKGKFFLIFWDHIRAMAYWGLKTDLSRSELLSMQYLEDEEIAQFIKKFIGEVQTMESPFSGNQIISSKFVLMGHFLFETALSQDSSFDNTRHFLNQKSKDYLPKLMAIIMRLPQIPQAIKDLLENFDNRFLT